MPPRRLEPLRPAPITALVRRMSASGFAVVLVLVLAMGAIVEQSVIAATRSRGTVALRHGPRVTPRPTTRPAAPAPVAFPLAKLATNVAKTTSAKLGALALHQYGKAPTAAPMVTVARTDRARGWAMGTTAIPVPAGDPAVPEAAFFLAHAANAHWQVALAGTDAFDDMLGSAPGSVIPAAQRNALSRYGTGAPQGTPTGLMLPYPVGQSWTMRSAPGGLAFTGGSGRVLAAGSGWLYRLCRSASGGGSIMIIHPNGLATTYSQLSQLTRLPDGARVKVGDYLGHIGKSRPCGGVAAPKPTVWFGITGQPLDGATIGGWTFHAETLSGFAQHAGKQVMPGGKLDNFGPPPVPVMPSGTATPSPFPSSISPTLPTAPTPLIPTPAALSPH